MQNNSKNKDTTSISNSSESRSSIPSNHSYQSDNLLLVPESQSGNRSSDDHSGKRVIRRKRPFQAKRHNNQITQNTQQFVKKENTSGNNIDTQHEINSNDDKIDNKSEKKSTFYIKDLKKQKQEELFNLAESLAVEKANVLNKSDLITSILKKLITSGHNLVGEGILEVLQEGYGFLRSSESNYVSCSDDVYVSQNQIRKYGLKTGDLVKTTVKLPKRSEKYFAAYHIEEINHQTNVLSYRRRSFDDLTPLFPNQHIKLENVQNISDSANISSRIIDIIAPLGKGQRALLVAPPRSGKTVLMQNIAHAISQNNPDITLIVLLIDERPEEVTDMSRSVKGEVVSSTFDEPSHRHVQLAEIVIEKAKRLVESGKDVVILLDSITRLARAYNNVAPSSGRVLSGGVDSNALQRPKRFFGAARNIEEGGSLTIIATALIETGSRMDEVIFEEFKGTGNAEIILDRKLADRRVFPAIDITKSGTRKEDLLLDKSILSKTWILRKVLNPMGTLESIEFFVDKLKNSKTNENFFNQMDSYNNR